MIIFSEPNFANWPDPENNHSFTGVMIDMKKIVLLAFFTAGFATHSFGQYVFDIKGKTMAYARGFEKSAKSIVFELSSDYISGQGIGQPEIFRRKEKSLPDLLVYYFPNTKDSTINYILYEWDDTNFAKNHDAVKQPVTALQPYIDKYLSIQKQAEAVFGKAETSGTVNDVALIETGRFKRKDNFSKDGVSVEMYVVLSNKQETNGIVSIMPTHRVRMYVRTSEQ
ncbi:hypothetical protein IDJ77_18525 [Mucilaginibacter sp. ZT4R22]|uniref:DUF3108 domain-containing protein n=1 Tax=Mucilaginibacter pankratovii TaxID=2772110 RepID=A0ABR7WU38_9SPHI|nr:hypothetical protein [Mucilaginibacter pankratovii]MBD1365818.1 hypothetical protein [Mucilaginibacter pankratovii]